MTTFQRVLQNLISLPMLSLLFLLVSCVDTATPFSTPTAVGSSPTDTPTATVTGTTTVTPTATVTPTTTITPTTTVTPTTTLTPTSTVTPTATVTSTPDWSSTPTQITLTASIIEVTQIGGYPTGTVIPKLETLSGWYTFYGRDSSTQNVRYGPGLEYAVRYRLSPGKRVQVYAWVSDLPEEAWLCIDLPINDGEVLCSEAVALVYAGDELGLLELEE